MIGEQRRSFPRMGVQPGLVLEQAAKRQGYLSALIAFSPWRERAGIAQHFAP
jgi:hypothetical protein